MGSLTKSSFYHLRQAVFHLLKLATNILVYIGGALFFLMFFGEGFFDVMFSSVWNALLIAIPLAFCGFYAWVRWGK